MSSSDAPRSDPLLPHPLSRFSDDPSNFRRRRNDRAPRPAVPVVNRPPATQKTEIKELPEGRYLIARRSDLEGDIVVLAKQLPWSETWVMEEQRS